MDEVDEVVGQGWVDWCRGVLVDCSVGEGVGRVGCEVDGIACCCVTIGRAGNTFSKRRKVTNDLVGGLGILERHGIRHLPARNPRRQSPSTGPIVQNVRLPSRPPFTRISKPRFEAKE